MRCVKDFKEASDQLNRIAGRTSGKSQEEALITVKNILDEVKEKGDKALVKFTKKYDGFYPDPIVIPESRLLEAWDSMPAKLKDALQLAHKRITSFHQHQLPKNISITGENGEVLERRWNAVHKAGIYVPGGRATYPSTVLMNTIPAKVAGVKQIFITTPGGAKGEINNVVLAAAHLAKITKVFCVGGAQSIGALAYGTETIPQVDVISGPGNIYVTLAKKLVYGTVGIDSLAGPSEVLIIADKSASVEQVATDLLAQAEHDPLAATILLTTSSRLAEEIPIEINKQLEEHPRKEICKSSLTNWGLIAICKDIESCIRLSDKFAPEHLELIVENEKKYINKINNAGAIFAGQWTPEAVGDYLAGPNHTLPTSGTARFSGALSVETFMKNTSLISFTKSALQETGDEIIELANSEGLHSHAESIKIRLKLLN